MFIYTVYITAMNGMFLLISDMFLLIMLYSVNLFYQYFSKMYVMKFGGSRYL
jgi:hypothetical protein